MKNSLFVRRNSLAALLLAASCASPKEEAVTPKGISSTNDALAGLSWTNGTLPTGTLVPPAQLRVLPGSLGGVPFWKSNNPEAVTGEGWLMTNGNNASQRGGRATPLSGLVALYLSHLNFMGSPTNQNQPTPNRDLYIHIIASNPNSRPITITGRGTLAFSNQWRFRQTNPSLKSAWYLCSEDWTNNRLAPVNQTIGASRAVEIAKVRLPAKPNGQDLFTTEGRYEFNVAGGGAYFSTVATFNGNTDRAIGYATGSAAPQAPGNQGSPIITVDGSGEAYGREAGIAANSAYFTGDVNVVLPATPAYMGLCYNTNARKPVKPGSNVFYQEQSAPYTMRLQSSTRTWGGYGHKYNARLILTNRTATQKNVRISLGANPINASISPDGNSNNVVFDSPVQTLVNNTSAQTHQVILFNNQYGRNARGPQRQVLRTVPVPANSDVAVNVICFVPGLGFGAGLQLDLESGI